MNETAPSGDVLERLALRLRAWEESCPPENEWPEEALRWAGEAGVWRGVIGRRYGGAGLDAAGRARMYEHLGRGSLTCALIISQRDGACELIEAGENAALAERLLPALARGELFATVSLSQLTTSRRAGPAALCARTEGEGFVVDGMMPWVTGARRADYIVAGAVVEDGRQVLLCVATGAEGVVVEEPMSLLALEGSETSAVRCHGVRVGRDCVVRGPAEQVLERRGPAKSLTVASIGIGVAGALAAMIGQLRDYAGAEVAAHANAGAVRYEELRRRLYELAAAIDEGDEQVPAVSMRTAVNDLLVRLAGTCLVLAKGGGYRRPGAVERLIREALFFLVWSAPETVQRGTLERLWS